MTYRTEFEQSKLQIIRAERRILSQREIVKKLRSDTEPHYSAMASDLLALMEDRIVATRRRHSESFGFDKGSREQSEMIVAN